MKEYGHPLGHFETFIEQVSRSESSANWEQMPNLQDTSMWLSVGAAASTAGANPTVLRRAVAK